MKSTVYDRLLRRELGERSTYSSIKGIYGDKTWVKDLDIVNELDGHNGCVNALRYASDLKQQFYSSGAKWLRLTCLVGQRVEISLLVEVMTRTSSFTRINLTTPCLLSNSTPRYPPGILQTYSAQSSCLILGTELLSAQQVIHRSVCSILSIQVILRSRRTLQHKITPGVAYSI